VLDVTGQKDPETSERTYPIGDEVVGIAEFMRDPDGMVRMVRLTFEGPDLDSKHLREFPLGRALAEAQEEAWDTATLETVGSVNLPVPSNFPDFSSSRPDGTDDWYRRFARTFRYAKGTHPLSPAQFISDQFQVPVTTVHRWTREARRRGFLPPDPRGKRSGK